MKRVLYTFVLIFLFAVQVKAQAPNSLNYQGVARNASGIVLPNQPIGLRFTVHQGTASGAIVYQETQTAITNLLGLFSVPVGGGVVTSGVFANIAWGANAEYLQVEMDPTGGTSYLDMGTNQFLSVPYALNSGASSTGWSILGNSAITNPAAPGTYGTSNFGSTENWFGTTDTKDVVFGTNKIERMRIGGGTVATAGNVGIGTSTPAQLLQITQTVNTASDFTGTSAGYNFPLELTSTSSHTMMYMNGGGGGAVAGIVQRAGGASTAIYSGLNNSSSYRIAGIPSITQSGITTAKDGTAGITVLNSTGNVGVNTTTPSQLLQVTQTANTASDFTGTSAGYNFPLELTSTSSHTMMYMNGGGGGAVAGIVQRAGGASTAIYSGLNNSSDYRIAGIPSITQSGITTAKDGTAGITVLNSTGNVGINTTSPTQLLQVTQTANTASDFTGTSAGYNFPLELTSTSSHTMMYMNGGGGGAVAGIVQRAGGASTAIYSGLNNSSNYRIAGIPSITQNGITTAKDGNAGITVLTSNGNVGIGTAAPAQMLHIVSTTNTAGDFGAAVGYNFPLEVESTSGASFLYLFSPNNASGVIERGTNASTAMYAGLNNTSDYRIAGISSLTSGAITTAKDQAAGITVLNSNGNVGVQKSSPAQALDVTGNVQFSQALMPNGLAGTTGQILQSNGANTAPTWIPAPTASGTAGGVNYGTGVGSAYTPAGAAGQVLQSNGTGGPSWVNVTALGATGDNWGSQTASTDSFATAGVQNTISGDGTGANPLKIAKQGATTGQVLSWNGTTWAPATASASGWNLTGNTAITNPAAPGTYRVSNFGAGENWIGTTDTRDVTFGTGKIERMRIGGGTVATAGNVGIGTATPAQLLHIVSTTNTAGDFGAAVGYNFPLEVESTSGASFLYLFSPNNASGVVERGTNASTAMYAGLNNTSDYRIAGISSLTSGAITVAKDQAAGITVLNSTGNVGINTASPSQLLQVTQTANTASDFTGTSAGYNFPLELTSTSSHTMMYMNGGAGGAVAGIVQRAGGASTAIYSGLNNSSNYRISGIPSITQGGITTAKDGSAGLTVLTSNGNVGVQKSSPAQALDVTGNVQFSQALMPNGLAGTTGQILQSNGANTAPTWIPAPTASGTAGGVNYGTGAGSAYTPSGAAGQVLQSNGTGGPSWVNVSALGATGGDNWGSQTASTDSFATAGVQNTISGDGTGANPLKIARHGATTGQVLSWNGTTWAPATAASSGWNLTGNTGITNAAAPATYGTSNFGGTENWIGTTDTKDVAFGTNKIERMRIGGGTVATAGNVGIGTSTPSQLLEISQNANTASDFTGTSAGYNFPLELTSTSSHTMMYMNGGAGGAVAGIVQRAGGASTAIYSGLNNSSNYRIAGIPSITQSGITTAKDGNAGITVLTSNGNVGIGTAAPAQMLHIVSTTNTSGDFGGAVGYNFPLEVQSTSGASFIYLLGNTATACGVIERQGGVSTAMYTGLNNSSDYRIAGIASISTSGISNAKDQSAGLTVLTSNGNVGVGTSAPNSSLQVAGSVSLPIISISSSTTLTASNYTVIITGGTPAITLPAASGNTGRIYVLVSHTASGATISNYIDFTGAGNTSIPANASMVIQSDGTNWNRIQ